ncbi:MULTISPECIES: hypothetical protein [unclassified Paenibacillus]|uniref:hypothetical protein n=1 Tax=unclassified Paenibacillus TaxID=185978 RepID=UPI0030173AEA
MAEQIKQTKSKIHPTCRICDKLNAEMTHCAIFGALVPGQLDNTALAATCDKSGDYIRYIHAVPNNFNYGKTSTGKPIDEEGDSQLLVYSADDETLDFKERHGISLEQWAQETFSKNQE